MNAVRLCTGKSYGSVYAAAAPFHRCEAVAGGSGERLRGNVDFLFKRFPRHEDPKERVGRGGTQVTLNGGSSLTYPAEFSDNREVCLQGEGFFDVRKKMESPFIVWAAEYQAANN